MDPTTRRDFLVATAAIITADLVLETSKILLFNAPWNHKPGKNDLSTIKNGINLLFGDDLNSGILPGNTNILRIRSGQFGMSKYVSFAYKQACETLRRVTGRKEIESCDSYDSRLDIENLKNLLIIGGPVANDFTREICKYNLKRSDNGIDVPIFNEGQTPLASGYYVGNEHGFGYWGNEKRVIRRPNEEGVWREFPLYGLMIKENGVFRRIEPPIDGDRLLYDMLSIIRVPNPYHKEDGTVTIIGGMHGYSLQAFFQEMLPIGEMNMTDNLKRLEKETTGMKYFQALIPAKIHERGYASIDWDGGRGDWQSRIIELH